MSFIYILILAAVLAISPFVFKLASKQDKKTKQQLKGFFLIVLAAQILVGFLNWKTYPDLLLGLFLAISILRFLFLLSGKALITLVILSFLNSVLIFIGMIKVSNDLGVQIVSLPAIGSVFLVLLGNVIGLIFINKDKNLLKNIPLGDLTRIIKYEHY